ncbi:MAG: protein translocase subunit SecD [Phycisphaerales bacterium]|nr:MAG: protein translocase subunit SecD [Phycisphaerales bacterium]
MSDKNLWWKLLLVVVIAGLAALMLYPPTQQLKGGIDLVGGYSLLYEIDTAGLEDEQTTKLAERVMMVLKDRVDPKGQRNLEWRPIGNNRLEVRMPAPPREAQERRAAYDEAVDALKATNVTRNELSATLAHAAEGDLDDLLRGVPQRRDLLNAVRRAYDARLAAMEGDDETALSQATEEYNAAVSELIATNVDLAVFGDILDMESAAERQDQLARFRSQHPARTTLIEQAAEAYEAWSKYKGSLEGPADLERLLRGAGVLEFRILAERDSSTRTTIQAQEEYLRQPIAQYTEALTTRGPRFRAGDRYRWFEIEDAVAFLNLDDRSALENFDAIKQARDTIVERYADKYYVLAHTDSRMVMLQEAGGKKWSLKLARSERDPQTNRPAVSFELDAPGGARFFRLTEPNVGKPLCILLDDIAISAPTLRSAIREAGQITGDFTTDEVLELVNKLEAGALPARLKPNPIAVKSIGPSLGASNRERGLQSALYGLALVLVFMAIYYLVGGFIANFAVLFNLLVTLALMAWLEATLTLPGIAGLILTVGMAVDANVLIFERMREEQAKGSSLRMVIKNGYDRAFSTIFDANVTTLITCVILGYVGSEEVKGFALTLGFGIATSMFSALFVTRVIFQLLAKYRLIKTVPMLHIPGLMNANFDWMRLWRGFWPASTVLVLAGIFAFDAQPIENIYDIEFLGGTSAQLELKETEKMTDEEVRLALVDEDAGAAAYLNEQADAFENVTVSPLGAKRFRLTSDVIRPAQLETYVTLSFPGSLDEKLRRGSLISADEGVEFELGEGIELDDAGVRAALRRNASYLRGAGGKLTASRIQLVREIGEALTKEATTFEVVTLETNQKLVRDAIEHVLGDRLNITPSLDFVVRKDAELGPNGTYPIPEEAQLLGDVIGIPSPFDVMPYRGGVAMVFEQINPAPTLDAVRARLRDMRLQPDYEQYEWRDFDVVGLTPAGQSDSGEPLYSAISIVVVDENFLYDEDPLNWEQNVAAPELALAEAALSTEKALQKVVQFAPSVAKQSRNQAFIALALAMLGIMGYLWFRFGSLQYGLAAVLALVHDSAIAVGLVALSYFIAPTILGKAFLIDDFRIDMTLVAAFLTVIGYSTNDTIVVFDRIRENRGKLATISATVVNSSINQCLSRTVLTSVTTLIVMVVMYLFGGPGIHGFNYTLIVGVLVGTYSSVAIASPLLLFPHLMRIALYGVVALLLIGACLTIASMQLKIGLIAGIVLVAAVLMLRERAHWTRPIVTGAQ